MSIKLYYSPGACSLAPHIVLEELGMGYELELVSVSEGQTQTTEYLKINPKGRVPALYDEGPILTEAPAILLYLGMSDPEKRLIPTSAREFARCIEWFNWLSGTVHSMSFGQLWRPQRFSDDETHYEAIAAKGRRDIAEAFSVIEKKLEDGNWAVGQHYSVVDPYILVFFRWGNRIGMDMRNTYPHWTQHALRLLERPAVVRSLDQERVSVWE